MATKQRLGDVEFDHAMMLGWFANAIMRGYDEGKRLGAADAQATIAALQARVQELEDGTSALLNQQSERLAVENEKLTMALFQLTQRTAELEAANGSIEAARRVNNDLQAELERVRGLIVEYAKAKTDFDEKRLQEDHYAGKERYNRLVEAENALLQHRQGMEG